MVKMASSSSVKARAGGLMGGRDLMGGRREDAEFAGGGLVWKGMT